MTKKNELIIDTNLRIEKDLTIDTLSDYLREKLHITYEDPIRGVTERIILNEPVRKIQLTDNIVRSVYILPVDIRFLKIKGYMSVYKRKEVRMQRRNNRHLLDLLWEESKKNQSRPFHKVGFDLFNLHYLFGMSPYETDEPS